MKKRLVMSKKFEFNADDVDEVVKECLGCLNASQKGKTNTLEVQTIEKIRDVHKTMVALLGLAQLKRVAPLPNNNIVPLVDIILIVKLTQHFA